MPNNILIIDDNEKTLETICLMTRNMNLGSVNHFLNAQEALAYIHDNRNISLIICDWNMPQKSGLELLRELREEGHLIPFIMVTARNDIDSVLEARRHGVNLYISKPFSISEFQQKINWVVAHPTESLGALSFHD